MSKTKFHTESPLLNIILTILGLGLAYIILVFLAKSFVFIGYNFFFFIDNLLQINAFNPIIAWSILGLLLGSITGVTVAIKKYRLSKKLLFYPIAVAVILLTIMYLVNSPADHEVGINSLVSSSTASQDEVTTHIYFYKSIININVRTGPSVGFQKSFVLKKGEEVELIKRNLMDKRNVEWMQIRYTGNEGFVNAKYLRFSRLE